MGLPRIVFDGNNLDFPQGLAYFEPLSAGLREMGTSGGAVSETLRYGYWEAWRIGLDKFASADFYRELWGFWSWASAGEQYAFARDSARMVNTTLDGSAAAGQKVIPLTSTTGIVVGNRYLVRNATLARWEWIEVDSISAGVSVTAVHNLLFAFAATDLFRDPHYFPKVVSLDADPPMRELPTNIYTFDHRFVEDRG